MIKSDGTRTRLLCCWLSIADVVNDRQTTPSRIERRLIGLCNIRPDLREGAQADPRITGIGRKLPFGRCARNDGFVPRTTGNRLPIEVFREARSKWLLWPKAVSRRCSTKRPASPRCKPFVVRSSDPALAAGLRIWQSQFSISRDSFRKEWSGIDCGKTAAYRPRKDRCARPVALAVPTRTAYMGTSPKRSIAMRRWRSCRPAMGETCPLEITCPSSVRAPRLRSGTLPWAHAMEASATCRCRPAGRPPEARSGYSPVH